MALGPLTRKEVLPVRIQAAGKVLASRAMKPSPSMVVAMFAVFIALGGTGYAASQYVVDSSGDVKKNTIRSSHIRDGSVGVADLSKSARNLASGGTTGSRGEEGPKGDRGATGPAGATGPQGPSGVASVASVAGPVALMGTSNGSSDGFSAPATATAGCPGGTVLTGGGATASNPEVVLSSSGPSGNGWAVTARNGDTQVQSVQAWAVCASP